MKITPELLSIPPHFSAPWSSIAALQSTLKQGERALLITLQNQTQVEITGLDETVITAIFDAHAKSVTKKPEDSTTLFADAMQHNPQQSKLPDLPSQVLERLGSIVKSLGFDEGTLIPSPEENCNCVYCQLSRSLGGEEDSPAKEEELTFRDWDIAQLEGKLYKVTSPLDPNEQYNVYLGTPLGCTCGHQDCEHIRAVLHT